MKNCIKIIAAGLALGVTAIPALADVRQDLDASARVLRTMEADANISGPLADARAVLFVPDAANYPPSGSAGTTGILLIRDGSAWTNPVFYDLSGIGGGSQTAVVGGSVAYLLMSNHAVDAFKRSGTFSLTPQSGISIDGWSAQNQAATRGDVIVWSNASNLLPQATAGIASITADGVENRAYYQRHATPDLILNREVRDPHVDDLPRAFQG